MNPLRLTNLTVYKKKNAANVFFECSKFIQIVSIVNDTLWILVWFWVSKRDKNMNDTVWMIYVRSFM